MVTQLSQIRLRPTVYEFLVEHNIIDVFAHTAIKHLRMKFEQTIKMASQLPLLHSFVTRSDKSGDINCDPNVGLPVSISTVD